MYTVQLIVVVAGNIAAKRLSCSSCSLLACMCLNHKARGECQERTKTHRLIQQSTVKIIVGCNSQLETHRWIQLSTVKLVVGNNCQLWISSLDATLKLKYNSHGWTQLSSFGAVFHNKTHPWMQLSTVNPEYKASLKLNNSSFDATLVLINCQLQ